MDSITVSGTRKFLAEATKYIGAVEIRAAKNDQTVDVLRQAFEKLLEECGFSYETSIKVSGVSVPHYLNATSMTMWEETLESSLFINIHTHGTFLWLRGGSLQFSDSFTSLVWPGVQVHHIGRFNWRTTRTSFYVLGR